MACHSSAARLTLRRSDGLPDEWERQHGTDPADDGSSLRLNGPLGDANANGISNLLEYALAIEAAPGGEIGLPKLSLDTNSADGQNYAIFSYRRRLGALDFDYRAEVSPNLVNWISATTELEEIAPAILNADGLTETVRMRVKPALGAFGADGKAIRLRVMAE